MISTSKDRPGSGRTLALFPLVRQAPVRQAVFAVAAGLSGLFPAWKASAEDAADSLAVSMADGAPAADVSQEERFQITSLILTGLERTDPNWLRAYLDQPLPATLTRVDAIRASRKLMTTGVYTDVKVVFEPVRGSLTDHAMHVHVEEKWTIIPVIRGAFGGGTPLRVFGFYNTHTLGKLLTVGVESRKYGDAPPGLIAYVRDPRGGGGRYHLGAEFWRDFRRRNLYDADGELTGHASTNSSYSKVRLLAPLASAPGKVAVWKAGSDIEYVLEASSTFEPEADVPRKEPPADLTFPDGPRRRVRLLPALVYDDIDVANLTMDGFRSILRFGPVFEEHMIHRAGDWETFAYKALPRELNLALHAFAGTSSLNTLDSTWFLGGLDSIRGIPDGALRGTQAAYVNAELRQTLVKFTYSWWQGVVFADGGMAGKDLQEARDQGRATAGVGVRAAVPQVYRLVFRFDYAWAIDGSGTQGITAGLNQFFDPYRPL